MQTIFLKRINKTMKKVYKSTAAVIYGIVFFCFAGALCSAFADGAVQFSELYSPRILMLCILPGGLLGFFMSMLLNYSVEKSDRLKAFSKNVIQLDLCSSVFNANSRYFHYRGTDPFSTVFSFAAAFAFVYVLLFFIELMRPLPESESTAAFYSSFRAAAASVSAAAVQLLKSRSRWISHLCSRTASELLVKSSEYRSYN